MFALVSVSRLLATERSSAVILFSTSTLFFCSLSKKASRSTRTSCFSRSWRLATENCSCARWIASSRFCIDTTACSHCDTSSPRSSCSLRKSSAVLSSSICAACVSVTSSSSSAFFFCTAASIFSSCSERSFIFASSAFEYLSSARLSSSFCRAASAHCSSSS